MPYSIKTKDGIIINKIPDNIDSNADILKERVAKLRVERDGQPTAPQAPQRSIEQPQKSLLGRIRAGTAETIGNIPSSAARFGKDILQAVTNPIDTAKALFDVGSGAIQLLVPGVQPQEDQARAVGQFFSDRYGSADRALKTLKNDPVGIVADISTFFTGGGALAARLPGIAGQVGKTVANVGKSIDPLSVVGSGIKGTTRLAGKGAKHLLGLTTGVGSEAIQGAFQAGRKGGEVNKAFKSGLRQTESMAVVLEDTRQALQNMRAQRVREFKEGSAIFKADKKILDFTPIRAKFNELVESMQEGGLPIVGKSTQNKLAEIKELLDTWEARTDLHNASGLDGLKKAIDDLQPSILEPGQAGRAVTETRNAVKNAIVEQVPVYADVMKQYETAIRLEDEIKRALSLGKNAAADTTLRKLQSLTRNNVNTNFGNRLELARQLEQAGGKDILPRLSGQALSSVTPRGLQGAVATGVGGGSVITGNPAGLALLPLQSPRLIGEAANLAGSGARLSDRLIQGLGITPDRARALGLTAFQGGREERISRNR